MVIKQAFCFELVTENKFDWPESQLAPPHAGDPGQPLLIFFVY
jgi:hypothetical protein